MSTLSPTGDQADPLIPYRRICSWCNLDMGAASREHQADTHGICPDCLAKQRHLLRPTGDQADSLRIQIEEALCLQCAGCGMPIRLPGRIRGLCAACADETIMERHEQARQAREEKYSKDSP